MSRNWRRFFCSTCCLRLVLVIWDAETSQHDLNHLQHLKPPIRDKPQSQHETGRWQFQSLETDHSLRQCSDCAPFLFFAETVDLSSGKSTWFKGQFPRRESRKNESSESSRSTPQKIIPHTSRHNSKKHPSWSEMKLLWAYFMSTFALTMFVMTLITMFSDDTVDEGNHQLKTVEKTPVFF